MAFEFTDENIEETIATGKPIVIDFWATWCGPCMSMAPTVDEVAKDFEGQVIVGKYNIEDNSDFATANRIMSIPTLLFFKDGKKTSIRLTGSQTKENLYLKKNL